MNDEAKIEHAEGMFEGTDGLRLYEQSWRGEAPPKAVLALVHGLYDDSDRYAPLAGALVGRGYAISGFDLRGHGRSQGARSFVRSFDDYLGDLEIFLARVRERNPQENIFVLAHSMGGTIATLYFLKRRPEWRGLLLSGAGLKVGADISPLLKRITPTIGRLFPTLPAAKLNLNVVSRDPAVVQSKQTDPLIHHGAIPARTGAEILRAIDLIQAQMEDMTLPLLIMHGTADRWTNPEGSKELYARARSTDKTLKSYEGFYHEILTDPEKARVIADVREWLDRHA